MQWICLLRRTCVSAIGDGVHAAHLALPPVCDRARLVVQVKLRCCWGRRLNRPAPPLALPGLRMFAAALVGLPGRAPLPGPCTCVPPWLLHLLVVQVRQWHCSFIHVFGEVPQQQLLQLSCRLRSHAHLLSLDADAPKRMAAAGSAAAGGAARRGRRSLPADVALMHARRARGVEPPFPSHSCCWRLKGPACRGCCCARLVSLLLPHCCAALSLQV
jgi:hypothetical protein